MTASLIDGKGFATALRAKIGHAVEELMDKQSVQPGLAVVIVGDDPASHVYVRNKGIATKESGMQSFEFKLPADTSEAELLALIEKLNTDNAVDGILVQSPVPEHINYQNVIKTIAPAKDVDGFHLLSKGALMTGQDGLVACTPLGCKMLLKDTLGDLTGQHAVVIGRSDIVGKPMALLLLQESCTVTVAHSKTKDLPALCREADIVVAAVGRPEMVKGDWIKPGACVIDVGINRVGQHEDGRAILKGDVAFDEAVQVAGSITPVPGGVGPMTIACLLYNTVKAACARRMITLPPILDF